jgi:hypothetical protein
MRPTINTEADDVSANPATFTPATLTPFTPSPPASASATLTIDCDCCELRDTDACADCLVTFLLEREPNDAVVIDADEERAVRMLERAGLVPSLRFTARAG